MFMKQFSTRSPFANGNYPSLQINWKLEEDGMGYLGEGACWHDGSSEGPSFKIQLRLGNPLGVTVAYLDPFMYGCFASTTFAGADISARDFQWTGAWAVEAIKRHVKYTEWRNEMRFKDWFADVKTVAKANHNILEVDSFDEKAWRKRFDSGMSTVGAIVDFKAEGPVAQR